MTCLFLSTAAANYVSQEVCSDTACSQRVADNTFNLNQCYSAAAGGSMMFLQCDSGVIYNSYSQDNCGGAGSRYEDPVGQCLSAATGQSFINFCQSGVAAEDSNQTVMTTGQVVV